MENYRKEINDVYVYGLKECFGVPDVDIDTGKPTCYVDWRLDLEERSWGLKSIDVYVTRVVVSIEWEVCSEGLTEEEKSKLIAAGGSEYRSGTIGGLIELNSKEKWHDKEWTLDSDFEVEEGGSCYPKQVEIDFEKMIITIF
jgi:hypothetical protein